MSEQESGGKQPDSRAISVHWDRIPPPSLRAFRTLRGFSLIELLAAILILGLLTAVAVVSLAGLNRTARMEDAAARVIDWDQQTRRLARRFDRPIALELDFAGPSSVVRRQMQRTTDGERADPLLLLPRGYRIEALRRVQGRAADVLEIGFCSAGTTPTYAVLLAGPREQRQWIVFAGLSGAAVRMDDEHEVDELFEALSGRDAR